MKFVGRKKFIQQNIKKLKCNKNMKAKESLGSQKQPNSGPGVMVENFKKNPSNVEILK